MGAWGPGLFSDDLACDVRGTYRELLEDGIDDDLAVTETLSRYTSALDDAITEPVVVLALAVTASKVGRLSPELKARAVRLLDDGRGLNGWEQDARLRRRRVASLAKARAQLDGAQPPRRRVRRPLRYVTSLLPGDVLAFALRKNDFVALRVMRLQDSRYFVAPIV